MDHFTTLLRIRLLIACHVQPHRGPTQNPRTSNNLATVILGQESVGTCSQLIGGLTCSTSPRMKLSQMPRSSTHSIFNASQCIPQTFYISQDGLCPHLAPLEAAAFSEPTPSIPLRVSKQTTRQCFRHATPLSALANRDLS